MRVFNFLAYDERNEGTPPRYSNSTYNDLLGAADQLALLVVADQVEGSGFSYDLLIEESADNVLWLPKNGLTNVPDQNRALAVGLVDARVFRDAGTKPSLALVRLRVSLTESFGKARIRIFATGRAFGVRAVKAAGGGKAKGAPWL